jgi:CrcB protein
MNQLPAVALGGACGAVVRFLMSTGIYLWLGREFPYGTLAVNVIGSFLLGLLTETLVVHRIAFGLDYRAAILVGFIGAFTTFSTFSLETVYLVQQASYEKALLNILASVSLCLAAVWLGLTSGKAAATLPWANPLMPYGLLAVNAFGSLLISLTTHTLLIKTPLGDAQTATLWAVLLGAYLSLSGLYIVLYLLEQGCTLVAHTPVLTANVLFNTAICLAMLRLGEWLANRLDLTNFH